ncbi:MogA/MoaB family molybdenum cofactor biosynthesis protein [Corynebacterium tapiri]|uniref:Molybdenum cofactor biosynthesis protein n=1 Tax=Corynebacterium tapiri TaxID=1448266 RepID=A0A5C4U8C2_9CORY|nr:molybdopterin-binding protein [Corynebacterium tapiri]TNM00427.1 molybdenum cofactor biosynthesis protein [Corynebacterium tapiri]
MNTAEKSLTGGHSLKRLEDVAEPDAAFLLASEEEESVPAQRRALIVLVSDYQRKDHEETSRIVAELLAEAHFAVDGVVIVRSKRSHIREAIETGVIGGVDLVLTIGGTGVGPRDKTPEATRDILDQRVHGISQALRTSAQMCGAIDATVSRGVAGVSGSTVVVNLASSRSAIRDGLATLPPLVHHLVDELQSHNAE